MHHTKIEKSRTPRGFVGAFFGAREQRGHGAIEDAVADELFDATLAFQAPHLSRSTLRQRDRRDRARDRGHQERPTHRARRGQPHRARCGQRQLAVHSHRAAGVEAHRPVVRERLGRGPEQLERRLDPPRLQPSAVRHQVERFASAHRPVAGTRVGVARTSRANGRRSATSRHSDWAAGNNISGSQVIVSAGFWDNATAASVATNSPIAVVSVAPRPRF